MISNFDETLKELDSIYEDTSMAKSKKKALLSCIRVATKVLSTSIEYRKLKADFAARGIPDDDHTAFLDETMDNNLLEEFFGDYPLPEMMKQLTVIKQKIMETSKANN